MKAELSGITHLQADVTRDEIDVGSLPERIQALVYCPGSIRLRPFHRLKEDDFLADLQINLLGAIKAIQACLAGLKKAQTPSSIVLFSTVAVGTGMPFHASIASAKGAFMTTPGSHRDTYMEAYYRHFFINYASGKAPWACGVIEKHVRGIIGMIPLAVFYADHPDLARRAAFDHLGHTHLGARTQAAGKWLMDVLLPVLGGDNAGRGAVLGTLLGAANGHQGLSRIMDKGTSSPTTGTAQQLNHDRERTVTRFLFLR